MLRNLPPFPILVDYRRATHWTNTEVSLALAALEHSGRVRGISLRTQPYTNIIDIFRALSCPFPELESLEIRPGLNHDLVILPDAFRLGSASRLRRLELRNVEQRSFKLSPLLSTVMGLVELSLTLIVSINAYPEESLILNLQRMSCLRRLELKLKYRLWHETIITDSTRPPASTGDMIILLPNLMELVLTGQRIYLEAVAKLGRYLLIGYNDKI
jgi:hypothetical protein